MTDPSISDIISDVGYWGTDEQPYHFMELDDGVVAFGLVRNENGYARTPLIERLGIGDLSDVPEMKAKVGVPARIRSQGGLRLVQPKLMVGTAELSAEAFLEQYGGETAEVRMQWNRGPGRDFYEMAMPAVMDCFVQGTDLEYVPILRMQRRMLRW